MKKTFVKQDFSHIKDQYPDMWVGLADFDMEGFQVKSAYLLCAGKTKTEVTTQLGKLIERTDFENYSVEWTGKPIERQEMISIVLKTV